MRTASELTDDRERLVSFVEGEQGSIVLQQHDAIGRDFARQFVMGTCVERGCIFRARPTPFDESEQTRRRSVHLRFVEFMTRDGRLDLPGTLAVRRRHL